MDQSKLYNLPEVGYRLAGEFTEYRLFTTSIPFHTAITRSNYETMKHSPKL